MNTLRDPSERFRDVHVVEEWCVFPGGTRMRLARGTCTKCGAERAALPEGFRRGSVACTSCSVHRITDVDAPARVGTCSVCGPGVRVYASGAGFRCAERDREQERANVKAGKCRYHDERDAAPGKTMCLACLEYRTARGRTYVEAGKCPSHSSRDVAPGKTQCRECLDAKLARNAALRADGFCACGRPSGGRYRCRKCEAYGDARKRDALERSDGTITDNSLDALFEAHSWFCALCGFRIDPSLPAGQPGALEWDHIVPLSKGGAHSISNLQPAHRKCNQKKRALLEDETLALFLDIDAFPEDRGVPDIFLPESFPECRISFGEEG